MSLSDQLRPVLNCIDLNRFYLNTVDFDFSLRGVLFESTLYVCVYEDIPFNLFNRSCTKQETNCVKKLQTYFFKNIEENFKKIEDNQDPVLIEQIKKDVKNSILLRLNEIKSGDSLIKRMISENLKENQSQENFCAYLKFNIGQVTSKQTVSSPSSCCNQNKLDNTQTSNPWLKSTNFMNNTNQQNEIESNKFFVYGFFFLSPNSDPDQSNSSLSPCSYSNRLVFYLFNCVPEIIKTSLITQSNSYLIRKSLFSTQKSLVSDLFKFYSNKPASNSLNPRLSSNSSVDLKSGQKNILKKSLTLSDILKIELGLTNSNLNDATFLNLIDFIEENCAKSYIRSLIHYLATFSLEQSEEDSFEKNSINRLLKLGTKIKLTDIDLTEYFKIQCKHISIIEDWSKCSDLNQTHLEKKFDDIFLKRFNLLPGFNDLFIFTSTDIEQCKDKLENNLLREEAGGQNEEDLDDEENDF